MQKISTTKTYTNKANVSSNTEIAWKTMYFFNVAYKKIWVFPSMKKQTRMLTFSAQDERKSSLKPM